MDAEKVFVTNATNPLKKVMYERMVQFATTLKDEFDAMSRKASGE